MAIDSGIGAGAGALRSPAVVALTGPAWSTILFSVVVVGTMVPAFFDLTLENALCTSVSTRSTCSPR